jgi:methyl-accepting chemotaxis protein
MLFALAALPGCGQKIGSQVEKFNLAGQLKKINDLLDNLNRGTENLVGQVEEMDEKESGLYESVDLLNTLTGAMEEQGRALGSAHQLVAEQEDKVQQLLQLCEAILSVESQLKAMTSEQVNLTSLTYRYITQLIKHLESLSRTNENINRKMDLALEVMRNM